MRDGSDLSRQLNPQQYEAAVHTEGPMMIFAGAGSGKTRVITHRAAHIVGDLHVQPYRVMCVTFTNKAAGEMRERLGRLLGDIGARDLWVATFHATGAKLLRRYHQQVGLSRDFAIYDDGDQRVVMNQVFDLLKLDDRLLHPRAALSAIDRFKQEALAPDAVADDANNDHQRRIAEVYANYERMLARNNAVDFGDLLKKLVELLERDEHVRAELQNRFRYVMIDEFQDTNAAQYRIVRALVGPERNLCVVGDDDQAIYRWRGADIRNLHYFRRDFPDARIVKLEQNYRSTARILRAANAVVERLEHRERKVLFTENGDGNPIEVISCRDEREEAQQIASRVRAAHSRGAKLADMAVFYRVHAQSRTLEEAVRAANIPYTIVGGMRFYERAEIKDTLAYLRLLLNPDDDVSFLRVVNMPPRGIGKTSLERLAAHARERGTSLWDTLANNDYPSDLQTAARKRFAEFHSLMSALRTRAPDFTSRPADLTSDLLDRVGYIEMLQADKSTEAESRRENLQELIGSMVDYADEAVAPTLSDYLEQVTLADPVGRDDKTADKLVLMTVHSAKGLEFDTVFVTGLEDGMFPYKGMEPGASHEEMDEERRLAYVAITRARTQLVLSHALFRQIFGTTKSNPPSRFLLEIPQDVLARPVGPRPGEFRRSVPPMSPASMGRYAAGSSSGQEANDGRPGELRVEYDEPIEPEGFIGGGRAASYRPGMKVKHPKFGPGTVKAVEAGADLKLVVYFPHLGGEKKVLAEFVKPL
jgi:DNA helicase-2/ATP-dependent DNA helicase PcrA